MFKKKHLFLFNLLCKPGHVWGSQDPISCSILFQIQARADRSKISALRNKTACGMPSMTWRWKKECNIADTDFLFLRWEALQQYHWMSRNLPLLNSNCYKTILVNFGVLQLVVNSCVLWREGGWCSEVVLSQSSSCGIFYDKHRAACKSAHHQYNSRFLIILVCEILIGILKWLNYFSNLKTAGECKLV